MSDFDKLQVELESALLGEDFEKKHAERAAKDHAGKWNYHNNKHFFHQERANFHKAAKELVGGPHKKLAAKYNLGSSLEDMKHHQTQAARHQALASAHEKLKHAQPTPPID